MKTCARPTSRQRVPQRLTHAHHKPWLAASLHLALGCALLVACEGEAPAPPRMIPSANSAPLAEAEAPGARRRHTFYVPAYSEIYQGDDHLAQDLAITVSVRNVDAAHPITIEAARYYNNDGQLLNELIAAPHRLGPMGSANFFVGENDRRGGHGANFIIELSVPSTASPPLTEAVMIGTRGGYSFSFVSRGVEVVAPTP